ncbi:MAG: hypothetical protein KGN77_04590 [Xanthomonadaceae bacterium]|nr:hypothetical protein [Xanthomonadaceae bacterium]MDE1964226.1 hypothetical protein [Xanthomonadaceae bacterium]
MSPCVPTACRDLSRRLALIVLAAGLAACGSPNGGATPKAGAAAGSAANDGVGILLNLAGEALKDHRLIAPAGANAVEFYLSVLELDPANATAHQNLARVMPQATEEVEQAINRRDLDEAARELRLLHEVDNNNFTVQLLAGKLDAQRAIVVREDEARAAAIRAKAAAAAEAPATR